jgi:uncharacterized membrane protein
MSHEHQATIDATVSAVANKVTYGGAGAGVASWIFSSEFGFMVSLLVAVAGLAVNWYYKRKQDRRLEAEHQLRMKELAE